MTKLTAEKLRQILHYDPETGAFTWLRKSSRFSTITPGTPAGGFDDGYLKISIYGRKYKAHRLAWLYVHGRWPVGFIDHRNALRGGNRFTNLREATRAVNAQNQHRAHTNNKSCGLLGVTIHKETGKWAAKISLGGMRYFAGLHDTPELAHAAYLTLKGKLHAGYVA